MSPAEDSQLSVLVISLVRAGILDDRLFSPLKDGSEELFASIQALKDSIVEATGETWLDRLKIAANRLRRAENISSRRAGHALNWALKTSRSL